MAHKAGKSSGPNEARRTPETRARGKPMPPASRAETDAARIAAGKAKFLETLATGLSVARCAKEAGTARSTPYRWAETDADFATAWREALLLPENFFMTNPALEALT